MTDMTDETKGDGMTLSDKDKATLLELSEMYTSEGWGSPDYREWERLTHPYSIDLLLAEIDSLKAAQSATRVDEAVPTDKFDHWWVRYGDGSIYGKGIAYEAWHERGKRDRAAIDFKQTVIDQAMARIKELESATPAISVNDETVECACVAYFDGDVGWRNFTDDADLFFIGMRAALQAAIDKPQP
jgi:hypothetical protein